MPGESAQEGGDWCGMGGVRRVEGIERLSFWYANARRQLWGLGCWVSIHRALSLQPLVSIFLPFSLSLG